MYKKKDKNNNIKIIILTIIITILICIPLGTGGLASENVELSDIRIENEILKGNIRYNYYSGEYYINGSFEFRYISR